MIVPSYLEVQSSFRKSLAFAQTLDKMELFLHFLQHRSYPWCNYIPLHKIVYSFFYVIKSIFFIPTQLLGIGMNYRESKRTGKFLSILPILGDAQERLH